jgi:predicted small lipoprotein YifL
MSLDYRKVAIYSVVLLALLLSLAACNSNKPPEVPPFKTFATSEDAGDQLFQAAKSGEQDAVLAIFGAPSKDVLLSGDPVQDKAALNAFVSGYGVMHRWRKMPDGSQILLVGADNFPFPIPLEKNAGGLWYFDTAAGKDEILRRRIGRNELAVIDVCGALAQAQAQYFSQVHADGSSRQYALKFISDPGKQNGLYWESQQGQPASPLGPLAAFATQEGYSAKQNAHQPFHGYYFHMLNRQGAQAPGGAKDYVVGGKMVSGFAFVAYPAEYGNSGVMTFMLNKDGVLLQKDLGKNTADIASAMSEFIPDASWTVVQD